MVRAAAPAMAPPKIMGTATRATSPAAKVMQASRPVRQTAMATHPAAEAVAQG